jgi:hypothetical protein
MADMAIVIGRDSADVHADMVVDDRGEFLLFPGHGVVELHRGISCQK